MNIKSVSNGNFFEVPFAVAFGRGMLRPRSLGRFNPVRLASGVSRGGVDFSPITLPELPYTCKGSKVKIKPAVKIKKPKLAKDKPVFFGYGGNLCFGHMGLAETLQKLYNSQNVRIYTKDKDVIQKSAYKALKTEEMYDPKILKNRTAYIISPSYTHAKYVQDLSQISELKGIYVDKPICISPKELEILKKLDASKIYAGDHYYFGNIAALRLMGVDMPKGEHVKINFDKTAKKKFTTCIEEAVPYFKDDEIKSIRTIMHETDENSILRTRNWYTNDMGGGILLDFQFHLHNLLNLMGLKLDQVDVAKGLKLPIKPQVLESINQGTALKDLKNFDKFNTNSVEEAVWAKGRINGEIPFEMDTVRGIKDNTRVLEIKGKNGQKILISASSSKKKVELFNRKGDLIGAAVTDGEPYDLMFTDVEEKLSNSKANARFLQALWQAQISSMAQIFDIKRVLGNLWLG